MSFYFKKYRILVFQFLLVLRIHSATAQDCCGGSGCTCGEDIAPSGIMNDHLHEAGQWMVSYRYMHVNMQNSISGSQSVGDNDVYNNYLMSPNRMNMDMHMIMVMYGISDRFTAMIMPSYVSSTMRMNMFGGGNASMNMPGMAPNTVMPNNQSVSGIGDMRLYGLYGIVKNEDIQLVGSLGVSIPTGNINAKAFQELYSNLHADYNMQPGAGTLDFLPGMSLLVHSSGFDWGAQAFGTLRPFLNANGYHFGNEGVAELWIAKKWASWMSNSMRIEAVADGSMTGTDPKIYSVMEPSADAANYGGFKAYLYPGINFYPGSLLNTTCKLRVEYGLPVYQYALGVQMASQYVISAALDFIF